MSGKKIFWVSIDLGIRGDYTGLYTLLDSFEAKECGDGVAVFNRDFGEKFLEALKQEIEKYVKIAKTDRIYVVYLDDKTDKAKGKFLFGGRKRAPWEGYATKGTSSTEEDS